MQINQFFPPTKTLAFGFLFFLVTTVVVPFLRGFYSIVQMANRTQNILLSYRNVSMNHMQFYRIIGFTE